MFSRPSARRWTRMSPRSFAPAYPRAGRVGVGPQLEPSLSNVVLYLIDEHPDLLNDNMVLNLPAFLPYRLRQRPTPARFRPAPPLGARCSTAPSAIGARTPLSFCLNAGSSARFGTPL